MRFMTPKDRHNPHVDHPGISGQLNRKLTALVEELIQCNIDLHFAQKELEATYIEEILKSHEGNIGQSATALGMHRNTLSKRIKALKIANHKS